ncbi:MAG: tRNA glutamyl-Q(34) synthetase GluQRS [Acidimicrobiales bacterium]
MPSGRFAPSPTGRLHLGNLRTALVAWLFARSDGAHLHLRFDDLDSAAVRAEHYLTQADDLQALGLDWDGEPIRQSDRTDRYADALAALSAAGLLYSCYCSRREIREAAQAPNRPFAGRSYPGTCRELTADQRAEREASGRPPALRVRADGLTVAFVDLVMGAASFELDDFVVRRNDGTPAYHLVTTVDDVDLGIEVVVRADDLLDSTSRQLHLASLLAGTTDADRAGETNEATPIGHAHVPLVLGSDGQRLAKRHGAVTLADRVAMGESPEQVLSFLAVSLGLCEPGEPATPGALLNRFDPALLPTEPLTLDESF